MSGNPGESPGPKPLHVLQLLGSGGAGSGAHVRSLAAGLVALGVRVTVCAPAAVGHRHGFAATGARFTALPHLSQAEAVYRVRALGATADLVHAHGMRAGLLAAMATRRRTTPLVVTWHARRPAAGGPARLRRCTERWVVRNSSVVLGASAELVDRARRRGARDARLAPVALPAPRPSGAAPEEAAAVHRTRAELEAVGRPLLLATAALEPGQGHELLLAAAARWNAAVPRPLLLIAGTGPLRAALEDRIEDEKLPVRLLGRRDDLPQLLAAADLALLADRWDGRALFAQEALRQGTPLVATAVGGLPGLVGEAAALTEAEPAAFGAAVTGLLADPDARAALSAAGRDWAVGRPSEDRTVAHVLSVYDEFA